MNLSTDMPFSFKTKWMTEHPAWPWVIFTMNTALIALAVASIFLLITQQQYLMREVHDIDAKLIQAVKTNQHNLETVAKKAGVPQQKIVRPELPVAPNVK